MTRAGSEAPCASFLQIAAQLPEALAEGRESIQHYLQFYQVLVEIGELVIAWDHLDRMWAALTGADGGLACASVPASRTDPASITLPQPS